MKLTIAVIAFTMFAAGTAAAKPWHGGGKSKHAGACYFEPRDIEIIRTYYEPRPRALPPGLAKKYYRTGHLPPGWAKRMEPLPVAIERQLVVLPPPYRRGFIDGAVVVYSPRTQAIVDIVLTSGW
jgi:hypothetical protein